MAAADIRSFRAGTGCGIVAGALMLFALPVPALAQAFLEDAELVDFRISRESQSMNGVAAQQGIYSDGSTYSFGDWYSSDYPDLRLTMMTPVSDNLGIYWGFGTGERGEKYSIDPSLRLGFVAMEPVSDNATVSLSMSVVVGGYLRERTCTADYGAIGGVQTVNCRMAGSVLPPSETLTYLFDEPPGDQLQVSLRYRLRF